MSEPKVSLIASSNRPQLYHLFFDSLKGTSVDYEVIFAGPIQRESLPKYENLRYIQTDNIKPAQCYEVARREAKGETIMWVADDCEFHNNVVGKAYEYWKNVGEVQLILSIQTRETGYRLPEGALFDMTKHRFHAYRMDTPLMAPLALMSKKFLDYLGGFDKRYVCGQYENDVVMSAYLEGGRVEIFGDKDCFIDIDHLGKSLAIGESKTEDDFLNRPFAKGYSTDRRVLINTWVVKNKSIKRVQVFQPYEEEDLLTQSQSNRGIWK